MGSEAVLWCKDRKGDVNVLDKQRVVLPTLATAMPFGARQLGAHRCFPPS